MNSVSIALSTDTLPWLRQGDSSVTSGENALVTNDAHYVLRTEVR